jgi:nucleoredoxin
MESNILQGKLLSKSGEVDASEVFKAPVIIYYFSAHWCPPCQKFTPGLIDAYNTWNKNEKQIEIVFVSLDKKETEFKDYYGKMPWLALPFKDSRIGKLAEKYEPPGIPFVAIVDKEENLLSDNGYEDLSLLKTKAIDEWKKLYKK